MGDLGLIVIVFVLGMSLIELHFLNRRAKLYEAAYEETYDRLIILLDEGIEALRADLEKL